MDRMESVVGRAWLDVDETLCSLPFLETVAIIIKRIMAKNRISDTVYEQFVNILKSQMPASKEKLQVVRKDV